MGRRVRGFGVASVPHDVCVQHLEQEDADHDKPLDDCWTKTKE